LRGFGALIAAPLVSSIAVLTATPALAQGFTAASIAGVVPIAIAVGGGGFGLIALYVLRRVMKDNRAAKARAAERIASLRAVADQYEALLSGTREVTVFWTGSGPEAALGPKVLGQGTAILRPGQRPEAILKFINWLPEASAEGLANAVDKLRIEGRSFDLPLKTRDGNPVRATGFASGAGTVLRIVPEGVVAPGDGPALADLRRTLAALPQPAYLRDAGGRLSYANAAYMTLANALGKSGIETAPAELIPQGAKGPFVLGGAGTYETVEFQLTQGRAGYLAPKSELAIPSLAGGVEHLGGLIDALATPVAIFDKTRELIQFNQAYAELWSLDPEWLRPGLEERAILDRLRTDGMLPAEADYHAWRSKHLNSSYNLSAPREHDPWHLPDGRTINVIAAPASPEGGVIYVFEDITQQLKLKSLNKALLDVQRSTINALTEAVAVFGTNGRLTLSNPRLSTIWKLPMNELGQNPHIDQLAEASGRAMEDGGVIWRDLKRSIIDLNPTRGDISGRIPRADGKLIDYGVVRLPDGQTMLTFLDVTDSANYSRVLKERNDALVTADRLKDAFVQNVSYELRSPLTNIIGFADLLASDEVGPLSERQRAYTDYIRASSATLGILIDNILDLANVDAGIAQLRPEPQDIRQLVEKARAGLAATFPDIEGETAMNLVVEMPTEPPPFIADGTRIVQVLYNLLSNAARYSEPGALIRLRVSARGERVMFVVDDEGTAMSEELRGEMIGGGADPNLTGRQRGAGLGLAIVKTFVNLHGGTVSIERREPRGTRVVVNLPADASAAGGAQAPANRA
jgi:signal transduction histidine kinase